MGGNMIDTSLVMGSQADQANEKDRKKKDKSDRRPSKMVLDVSAKTNDFPLAASQNLPQAQDMEPGESNQNIQKNKSDVTGQTSKNNNITVLDEVRDFNQTEYSKEKPKGLTIEIEDENKEKVDVQEVKLADLDSNDVRQSIAE